jgi:hypothetical protein
VDVGDGSSTAVDDRIRKSDDTGIVTNVSARVGAAVGGGIGTSVSAGRITLKTRASAPFV